MSESSVSSSDRGRNLRGTLGRLLTRFGLARMKPLSLRRNEMEAAVPGLSTQVASVVEWIRGAEQHLATLQEAHDREVARLNSVFNWIESAEQHLGGLQEAHERLVSTQPPGTDPVDAVHARLIEPLLAWIRGAEQHLRALQEDHERLRSLHQRQVAQLDRITARAALIDARLGDLERADTEIAVAVAKRSRRPEDA